MLKSSPVKMGSLLTHFPGFLRNRLLFPIFLIIILAVLLSGCATLNDPEASQDFNTDIVGTLDSQVTVGQTFISRRAFLNGMTIWLSPSLGSTDSPGDPISIPIKVELFHSVSDTTSFFSTEINISSWAKNQPVLLNLKNQKNLPGQGFYIQLTSSTNPVQVHGRAEDAYPHGQLYINQLPLDADIAFRLSYEYNLETFAQDVNLFINKFPLVIPLIFTLLLPGWLLLDLSGLSKRFDLAEQIGMALGISLAFYPLLMLWTTYAKLSWTRERLIFLTFLIVIMVLLRIIYRYLNLSRQGKITSEDNPEAQVDYKSPPTRKNGKYSAFIVPIALLFIFLASLAVRLIMIRDLATPAWVDSVHHALITRLIMTQGSLPFNYAPYLNIIPTDYHPGFHSLSAVFTWLSSLELTDSLLILGQVLNASAVFSVYLITKSLTRYSLAGLFAALITGLLSPMPAYYTSWGRYTELTGLIILPAAFALISLAIRDAQPVQKYRLIILGAFTSAGLYMVHYRVFAFLILLLIPFTIIYLIRKFPGEKVNVKSILLTLTAMTALAIVFIAPWFIQSIKDTVLPNLSGRTIVQVPFFQDFSWSYLTAAMGKQILVLAGLGSIWGTVRKERFPILLLLWMLLLFSFANLGAFGLPGGGLISNLSVEIMLFIPISILGGYLLSQVISLWLLAVPPRLVSFLVVMVIFSFGVWGFFGARLLVGIINPVTILSRNADLPAIEWINKNIPENETVVINPFNWGYGIYAGNDGGYWISPLTGRLTLPPPVLYGLGSDTVGIIQHVQAIISSSSDLPALRNFMVSIHLKYIFIGARGGVLSPDKLMESGLFDLLYFQDGVWIFSLKP